MAVIDMAEMLGEVVIVSVVGEVIDGEDLARWLLVLVKEQVVSLVGLGGLLNELTKNVFETAWEAGLAECLGQEQGGMLIAVNMRDGTWVKTVLTEIGLVQVEVPWDRDGLFELAIVSQGERWLGGSIRLFSSFQLGVWESVGSWRLWTRCAGGELGGTSSLVLPRRCPGSWRSSLRDRWRRSTGGSSSMRSCGDHPALEEQLGRVHALPRIRRKDPSDDLHDEHDQVDQRPLPQNGPRPRIPPKRTSHVEVSLPPNPVA